MRLTIDTQTNQLTTDSDGRVETHSLYSREAFELLTRHWVRVGWQQRYSYNFTWLGRPIIQLPDDMVRMQEVVYRVKPDVIVETGIARGGSLIYSASLCRLLGKGRVIGVDLEIRPENRAAVEAHELAPLITMIEGSSTDAKVVAEVHRLVGQGASALVILDSNHTRDHVARELEAYCDLVGVGSYIVATDGIMRDLWDVPSGKPEWQGDHPAAAAKEFAARHPEFRLEAPPWPFHDSTLKDGPTYWPDAWLLRTR
jgi:cephalosporin hydroxylase